MNTAPDPQLKYESRLFVIANKVYNTILWGKNYSSMDIFTTLNFLHILYMAPKARVFVPSKPFQRTVTQHSILLGPVS